MTSSMQTTIKLFFLHHSVGRNLIKDGLVRELIAELSPDQGKHYEFWDHDYNRIGLSGPNGEKAGVSYHIPNDNTDPDGLAALFAQADHDSSDNAMSHILNYDVIAFKSCYPASAIRNEKQLGDYQKYYRQICEVAEQHPKQLFIALTPPPLAPFRTNSTQAKLARRFANWLKSGELSSSHQNFLIFDFFDLLAEPDSAARDANMLKKAYRRWLPFDSHPNKKASKSVAPQFVEFLIDSVRRHQS